MANDFDPYYTWLGIPPKDQPPNLYRLLGLDVFEGNPTVIDYAADRQMTHLRAFQNGARSQACQKLLNEVAAARVCLLNTAKKAAYDQRLRYLLAPVAEPLAEDAAELLDAPLAEPISELADAPLAEPLDEPASEIAPPARTARQPTGNPRTAERPAADFFDSIDATTFARPKTPSAGRKHEHGGPSPPKFVWWMAALPAAGVLLLLVVWLATRSGSQPDHPHSKPASIAMKSPSAQSAVEPANSSASATESRPAAVECSLVFDWPESSRESISVKVDGDLISAPESGPWEYRCQPGTHQVFAERTGYHSLDEQVTIGPGERRIIADAFEPKATVVLEWTFEDRSGSELRIDGDLIRPAERYQIQVPLEPGLHSIRITRDEKLTYELRFSLAPDQRKLVHVPHIPDGMGLLVIVWPREMRPDSQLVIDGRSQDLSTDTDTLGFTMRPGSHTVRCIRPGFADVDRTIAVEAGWPPVRYSPFSSTAGVPSNRVADDASPEGSNSPAAGNGNSEDGPANSGSDEANPQQPPVLQALKDSAYGEPRDLLGVVRVSGVKQMPVGDWSKNGGEVSCEAGPNSRVELPVGVTGGYCLEVKFERFSGDNVRIIFPVGSQQCSVVFGTRLSGFETVDGLRLNDPHNKYSKRPGATRNRHKYVAQIRVRQTTAGDARIDVLLDGKPFLDPWIGKQDAVSLPEQWSILHQSTSGLGADHAAATFYSATLRVVIHRDTGNSPDNP